MAAGYQQRLCHLNGRGRCVPMKQNILNNLFEKSLDNWLLSWQTFIKEH